MTTNKQNTTQSMSVTSSDLSGINDTSKDSLPNITLACGPAIHECIAAVNKAVLELFITAGRLGDSEPLAPILLGVEREILDELASASRADLLAANAYGLPLVELRIKDPAILRRVIRAGFGSHQAIAEITKTLPLEVITKIKRRF